MRRPSGFSLIEILIATALVVVAAMAAVAYVTRAAGHADWSKDKLFARQKALSILAELRGFVEGGGGEVASDLDGFDDGLDLKPSLTISPDEDDAGAFVSPEHPLSGNHFNERYGHWNWYRRITVRRYPDSDSRDLRICTVRVYRVYQEDELPGIKMAEVSTVVRTVAEVKPSTRVFDVYLLALENVPGWWVHLDAVQPYVDAALADLEIRNPGLKFRAHWITKLGYGRDDEYAPYTNLARESTDDTAWTYVYPGAMPAGSTTSNYYTPNRMEARVNLDGENSASFLNDAQTQEPYSDQNGNGRRDAGEMFTDQNGNGVWDVGNPMPYAFADQHNHCKRVQEAYARYAQRLALGLETEDTLTLRLLLDHMNLEPEEYRQAILINLHGELLPMPPVRNVSDAAKDPEGHPGWRVVAHPERLRPKRVAGNDAASDAPVFRVYGYKTSFPTGHEALMTQAEPYTDTDGSGAWEPGEPYLDWNGNLRRDAGTPLSMTLSGGPFTEALIGSGDFAARPNATTNPSIIIERLAGGIDADGDAVPDAYSDWTRAARYPEPFVDANSDGRCQIAEAFLDLDGDGLRGPNEPFTDRDGDGVYTATSESLTDDNGNGRFDDALPAEPFTDANGNGRWDGQEPYWDRNGNGLRDGPTTLIPPPWIPWNPALYSSSSSTAMYISQYGEPFLDLDNDKQWDAAEAFFDSNANGACDGGFERGEMWYEISHDAGAQRTVLTLHGTPLETPELSGKGLESDWRLYDLEYVPCPTPATAAAGGDRFEQDLFTDGDVPKNTARWRVTLPLAQVRRAFESSPGAQNGDTRDVLVHCETRIGTDLTTGAMWPTRVAPQNASRTYAWFHASPESVPFSERHQMLGDPRHCPYADTDRHGDTAPHGYNWMWDNFVSGADDHRADWLAFDTNRMRDSWRNRMATDVPRQLQWLRQAVVKSGATMMTLSGFSFFHLSQGGDVGYDDANGYPSGVPLSGLPFGQAGTVYENTLQASPGTAGIAGSTKFVRTNAGASAGIRSGGYWWSKPWLGELFPDEAYATQWQPHGNLRAGLAASGADHRLVQRSHITSQQRPQGTTLPNSVSQLAFEGCTSFFNIGTPTETFHHQLQDGTTGSLVGEGFELAANYGYPMPTTVELSRPFHLETSFSGGVGSEWAYTDAYPRHEATLVRRYYDHASGATGSGLVRLSDPGTGDAGFLVVNGLDRAAATGTTFVSRYSLLTVVHSALAAGHPAEAEPIPLLPRIELKSPTMMTELDNPATISVSWKIEWKRWDGLKYTDAFPDDYAGDERELAYRLIYSSDGGTTWRNMKTDEITEPGRIDWVSGLGPDSTRMWSDWNAGDDETWTWPVPVDQFPAGSYLVRAEVFRRDQGCGYAMHEEKIYVDR
ncbi:MAG: prepilin-type N-terminal cleavage/methylation domain-containing protein [Planctomycetota bacterium]|nr:prepilin-type N-terminal cleavage/methylation domain-containing protein [Planctomycetota bacterium]